jgi:hypothetical protein
MNSDAAAAGAGRKQAIARRSVLRGLGVGALATGAGGVLAACSSGSKAAPAASSTSTITLAYIAPFTGALAGFASGDNFVIDTIRATPAYAKASRSVARPTRSASSSPTAGPTLTAPRSSPASSSSGTTWICC